MQVFLNQNSMKLIVTILTLGLICVVHCGFAQKKHNPKKSDDTEPWISFTNKKTELTGYKDKKGNIKIPAKLGGVFGYPDTFYNIMEVVEAPGKKYEEYYLLKNGKKIGRDSIYVFDFQSDFESEGKIRYHDYKTDKYGFFDKDGKVVIPAEYDGIDQFHNGLTTGWIHAERIHYDKKPREHSPRKKGGEMVLINDKNEVLVHNYNVEYWQKIDWYSMEVNKRSADSAIRVFIKGENGNVYSFIEYQKEFALWFYADFLPAIRAKNKTAISNFFFEEVEIGSYGGTPIDSDTSNLFKKEDFTSEIYETYLYPWANKLLDTSIIDAGYNNSEIDGYYDHSKYLRKFFSYCGKHNNEKYPNFKAGLNYNDDFEERKKLGVSELKFIRTENGYKLYKID